MTNKRSNSTKYNDRSNKDSDSLKTAERRSIQGYLSFLPYIWILPILEGKLDFTDFSIAYPIIIHPLLAHPLLQKKITVALRL